MTDADVLNGAAERISKNRTGTLSVIAQTPDGRPAAGRTLRVRQTNSAFLFGCNIFALDPDDEGEMQRAFQDRFCELLNFATIPFYWGGYEPTPGQKQAENRKAMAAWCAAHGLLTKGHPLVWHEVYPAWADEQETPALVLQEARVREIVAEFARLVDIWDVINESTVSANARWKNGVAKWAAELGMVEIAAESMRWAREAGPDATLILNDFNLCPDYESQIEQLLAGDRRPDVIGLQSHMHQGEWTMERVWEACETYARFGLPLHFTETSVLSGTLLPGDADMSVYRADDWPSTPEGEAKQADYVEQLYTVLYSHPAVEAVTWWDLADGHWLNAPSGLIRRDHTAKPAYDRLMGLIKGAWRTDAEVTTDADGAAELCAFHGSYEVVDAETGETVSVEHTAGEPGRAQLRLA